MIAADEGRSVRQLENEAVTKMGPTSRQAPATVRPPHVGIEADFSQCDNHSYTVESPYLSFQMDEAAANLLWCRFVVGRRATHGHGDERVFQLQSVVRTFRCWPVRKAGSMESRHQKVSGTTGPVAGEHAACSVRAVSGGCKSNNEQSSTGIAEAGNRPRPIRLFAVGLPLIAGDALAIGTKTWTLFARHDSVVNCRQDSRGPTYHTRHIVARTIADSARQENAFWNSGIFDTTPFTR